MLIVDNSGMVDRLLQHRPVRGRRRRGVCVRVESHVGIDGGVAGTHVGALVGQESSVVWAGGVRERSNGGGQRFGCRPNFPV